MGAISFRYSWTTGIIIKFRNLILKKGHISGLAQIDRFSDFLVLGVANFRINYLRQFSFNFENSCAYLAANFLNFSKHPTQFLLEWFWRELWTKTTKIRNQKICHFKPTQKFNLFWGWDFSTFFLLIWFKSTKMKFRPYFTMEKS